MGSQPSAVLTVTSAEHLPQGQQDVLAQWHRGSAARAVASLTATVCAREGRPSDISVDVLVEAESETFAIFVGNPERTAVQVSYGPQSLSLLAPHGLGTSVEHVINELAEITRRLTVHLENITR